jgi:hypothetical protein
MFGPGELFFGGDANSETTGVKGPFVKDSGENIMLNWTVFVNLSNAQERLNVRFAGYDEDIELSGKVKDPLGEVVQSFGEAEEFGVGDHKDESSTGDFILFWTVSECVQRARPGA